MSAYDDTEKLSYEDAMNKEVRIGFVRKVLSIVFVQLVITLIIVLAMINITALQNLFIQYFAFILIGGLIVIICCTCIITCCPRHPIDFIALLLFTIAESLILGGCCMTYDKNIVYTAMIITGLIVLSLTVYAFTTKTDFTGCGVYLFTLLMIFVFCGMFAIFGWFGRQYYALIGAAIFSLYLVYDIQLCIGSAKFTHEYAVDMYCVAALNIYLDIINLFVYILSILGNKN